MGSLYYNTKIITVINQKFCVPVKLLHQILLLVIVPLSALLALGIWNGYTLYNEVTATKQINKKLELVPLSKDLINALQTERGHTSQMFANPAMGNGAVLAARATTDETLKTWLDDLAKAKALANPKLAEKLTDFTDKPTTLNALRQRVDAASSPDDSLKNDYTTKVTELLSLLGELRKEANDAQVSLLVGAYVAITDFQERFGQLRALGAAGLRQGQLTPSQAEAFVRTLGQRESAANLFQDLAPEELDKLFLSQRNTPLAVELRAVEKALAASLGGPIEAAMDSTTWYNKVAERMGQMETVMDATEDQFKILLEQRESDGARLLLLIEILVGSLVLASGVGLWWLLKSLRALTTVFGQVKESSALLEGTADQLFSAASNIKNMTDGQADRLNEIYAAVEELTASVTQISTMANSTTAMSDQARQVSAAIDQQTAALAQISATMNHFNSDMKQLQSNVSTTNSLATQVSESAQGVSGMMKKYRLE